VLVVGNLGRNAWRRRGDERPLDFRFLFAYAGQGWEGETTMATPVLFPGMVKSRTVGGSTGPHYAGGNPTADGPAGLGLKPPLLSVAMPRHGLVVFFRVRRRPQPIFLPRLRLRQAACSS